MLTSSESPSSCSRPVIAPSKSVPSSLMINLKSFTGTGIIVHCSGAEAIKEVSVGTLPQVTHASGAVNNRSMTSFYYNHQHSKGRTIRKVFFGGGEGNF